MVVPSQYPSMLSLTCPAGTTIPLNGQWDWDVAETGVTLDASSSGFNSALIMDGAC